MILIEKNLRYKVRFRFYTRVQQKLIRDDQLHCLHLVNLYKMYESNTDNEQSRQIQRFGRKV